MYVQTNVFLLVPLSLYYGLALLQKKNTLEVIMAVM